MNKYNGFIFLCLLMLIAEIFGMFIVDILFLYVSCSC
jgi:hypothetical protein